MTNDFSHACLPQKRRLLHWQLSISSSVLYAYGDHCTNTMYGSNCRCCQELVEFVVTSVLDSILHTMFKKAKSRPSLRARDSEDPISTSSPLARSSITANDPDTSIDVEDEDGDVSMGSVFERKKAGKRDKEKRRERPLGTSRLSFGGDKAGGEGEASKPRRSLLSQSTTARLENAVASSSSPLGASPSYSSDYLSQLKANTPTRGPRPAAVDDGDDIEEVDANGLSKMARDKYASVDTTEGIPDTAAIAAAKMKRQARVESSKHDINGEEDFISLGGGKLIVHDGEDRGPHPESRLMREEDEGDEGDEGELLESVSVAQY